MISDSFLGADGALASWKLVLVCNMKKIVSEFKSYVVTETIIVSLLFLLLSSLGFIFIHSVGSRWQKAEEKLAESERQLIQAQKIAKLGHWELTLKSNNLVWSDFKNVKRYMERKVGRVVSSTLTYCRNIDTNSLFRKSLILVCTDAKSHGSCRDRRGA